jgi:hypothetical protein
MGSPRIKKSKSRLGVTEFNDADKLVLFLYRFSELATRQYFRTVKWSVNPLQMTMDGTNEDMFCAFVLTFRHFYATNEPTELNKIGGILAKAAQLGKDHAMLDELRRIKTEFDGAPVVQLEIFDPDGKVVETITPQAAFDMYFNCKYFHTDPRGAAFIFQLPRQHQDSAHHAFQWSFAKHVKRMQEYLPLVRKVLTAGVLPKGGFTISDYKDGDDSPNVLYIPFLQW